MPVAARFHEGVLKRAFAAPEYLVITLQSLSQLSVMGARRSLTSHTHSLTRPFTGHTQHRTHVVSFSTSQQLYSVVERAIVSTK